VVFTLVVLVLMTATLTSLIRRTPGYTGFAVFGWGFLLLAFVPCKRQDQIPFPRPLTTALLKDAYIHFQPKQGVKVGFTASTYNDPVAVIETRAGVGHNVPYSFLQVGSSILSLLAGGVGSLLARRIAAHPVDSRLSNGRH
jgi:hypothetical protein